MSGNRHWSQYQGQNKDIPATDSKSFYSSGEASSGNSFDEGYSLTPSRSPVIGKSGNPPSVHRSPVAKKTLFTTSDADSEFDSNRRRNRDNSIWFIIFILVTCGGFLATKNNTKNYKIEPDYPTPNFLFARRDWLYEYNIKCCVESNLNKTFGHSDCIVNPECYSFLDNWSHETWNNQFNKSPLSSRCCYDIRPAGSTKAFDTYCSYTCLNTYRNKK